MGQHAIWTWKGCSTCGCKDAANFSVNRVTRSGLQRQCKDCLKAYRSRNKKPSAPVKVKPKRAYRAAETWSVDETGHYVGNDGFVCPKTFAEYIERFPNGVASHVSFYSKLPYHMHEELVANLHLFMVHRKIVEKFDPAKRNGCSIRLFLDWIRFCLKRKSQTITNKWKTDALAHKMDMAINYKFGTPNWLGFVAKVQDEATRDKAEQQQEIISGGVNARQWLTKFRVFIADQRAQYLPVFDLRCKDLTYAEIAKELGVSSTTADNHMVNVRGLAKHFVSGTTPAKRVRRVTKPYKRRNVSEENPEESQS